MSEQGQVAQQVTTNEQTPQDTNEVEVVGQEQAQESGDALVDSDPKSDISKRFAILTKKEKLLLESKKNFAEERKKAAEEKEALAAELNKYKQSHERSESLHKLLENGDHLSLLKELGLLEKEKLKPFMESITKHVLDEKDLSPAIIDLRRELSEIKAERAREREEMKRMEEERQKRLLENQAEEEKRAIDSFKKDMIAPFLKDSSSTHEAISIVAEDDRERVEQMIIEGCADQWKRDGKLDFQAVVNDIEEKLLTGLVAASERLEKSSKLKSRKKTEDVSIESLRKKLIENYESDAKPTKPRTLTSDMRVAPVKRNLETENADEAFQNALALLT